MEVENIYIGVKDGPKYITVNKDKACIINYFKTSLDPKFGKKHYINNIPIIYQY